MKHLARVTFSTQPDIPVIQINGGGERNNQAETVLQARFSKHLYDKKPN